jgi:hypothetical protein
VIGAFADDADARAAVARLRAAGIPPDVITVTRRAAPPAPPELPTMSRVFWSGFWGSVAGAILGALVGLVFAVLDLGVPGTPSSLGIQVAAWTMGLHVIGALVGCYLALDTGDRFARKPHHHDQPTTLVRVRSADAGLLAVAENLFSTAAGGATHAAAAGE